MGSSRAGGKKLSVPRVSGEMGELGDSDGEEFNGDCDDDMILRFSRFLVCEYTGLRAFQGLGNFLEFGLKR